MSIAVIINEDGVCIKGEVEEVECEDNGTTVKRLGVLCKPKDLKEMIWGAGLLQDRPNDDLTFEFVGGRA
ncbi:MAG: hypothetical protein ACXADO_00800 [Candidatus Thorarchaeota archaeon]|jgi:hypothetical protein